MDMSEEQARIVALEVMMAGVAAALSAAARGLLRTQMKAAAEQLGGATGEAIMRLRSQIVP